MKKLLFTIAILSYAFYSNAQLQFKNNFGTPGNPTHATYTNGAGEMTIYYQYDPITNLVDSARSFYDSVLSHAYKIGHDVNGNQTSYVLYGDASEPAAQWKQNWSYSTNHDTYSQQELPSGPVNLTNYYHHYTGGVIDTTTVKNGAGVRERYAVFTWHDFPTRKIGTMYVYNNSNQADYRELNSYGYIMTNLTFHEKIQEVAMFDDYGALIGWQGTTKETNYFHEGNLVYTRNEFYNSWETFQWVHQGDRYKTYDQSDRLVQDSILSYSEEVPELVIDTMVIQNFYSTPSLRKANPFLSSPIVNNAPSGINIFPNPVVTTTPITISGLGNTEKIITVVNNLGVISFDGASKGPQFTINSVITPGVHNVIISDGGGVINSTKLVVE
jgi:hypothetical protein